MKQYFPNIQKIEYEGPKSRNPFAFNFYQPDEVIAGKKMREHLKFALAYWHTMTAGGRDMFGPETIDKSFGETSEMAIAKARAYAAFELMDKLQLDYFCFHDRDIAPEAETLRETNARLDEIVALIKDLMQQHDKKLLWGTANLFSNPRYMAGAGSSPFLDAYAYAVAQVKKAIEITVDLGGEGYTFWGGREGYDVLLNTDVAFELDNLARFMHMMIDYGRSIGFKGCFYIEPKPKEPTAHQYDFDAQTALQFIQKYGFEKDVKLNIEANHATLAGHSFQHELRVAAINDALGSIDANAGNMLLGWDTDEYPTNLYETTLAMYELIKAGGFTTGGLNLDAKTRRQSNTPEDIVLAFIAGMDSYALGLKMAYRLIEDGRIDEFVRERYSSFDSELGKKILAGETSVEELEAYVLDKKELRVESGREELLQRYLNNVLFG